ncbi:MAG: hypothetical protein ACXVZX_08835 [Terriglobales bacterium]
MNTEQIVKSLKEERDRLDEAIAALDGGGGGAAGKVRMPAMERKRSGGITAAGRKRLSQLMKKRWAERRKKARKAK